MLSLVDAKRLAFRSLGRQSIADGSSQLDKLARDIFEVQRKLAIERGENPITLDELMLPRKVRPRSWKSIVLAESGGQYIWFAPRRKRFIYHTNLGRLLGIVEKYGGRIMLAELGQVWPTPDSCPNDPRRTKLAYKPTLEKPTLEKPIPEKPIPEKPIPEKPKGKWAGRMIVKRKPLRHRQPDKVELVDVTLGDQKYRVLLPYIPTPIQLVEYTLSHPKPKVSWDRMEDKNTIDFMENWEAKGREASRLLAKMVGEQLEEKPIPEKPIPEKPKGKWAMVGRKRNGAPVYMLM